VVNDEEEIESLTEEEDWYRYSDFYPIFYLHSYLHLKRKEVLLCRMWQRTS
jgi:hypothetical protein